MTNIVRFVLLVLLQVLVLQYVRIGEGYWRSFHFLIYPLFIFLLPLRTPKGLVILLGFVVGLTVDFFYDSLGIHAAASTFTAFIRASVIRWLSPKGGYNINFSPTRARMGLAWFIRYTSILLFIHLFFYFSVEFFTYAYWAEILKHSISSFLASGLIILVQQTIFGRLD
nr:rod shape-determining protein MreD [Desulfobacula sp.]